MDKPDSSIITKKILIKALGEDTEILSHIVTLGTKPGDNYMSLIYSIEVHVRSKQSSETIRHLLMKCFPNDAPCNIFLREANIFHKELEIYRHWMSELTRFQTEIVGLDKPLKLPYAPFVYGESIDFKSTGTNQTAPEVLGPFDNFIIMEDIRKTMGFKMTNRAKGFDPDQMRIVVSALAKVHAFSWAYRNHIEKDILKKFPYFRAEFSTQDKTRWLDTISININRTLSTLERIQGSGSELRKAILNFKENADPVFDVFHFDLDERILETLLVKKPEEKVGRDATNPEPWRIICHGDCWSNNMLFRYDDETQKPLEVILVDFQFTRETCIVNDLVYILYVCASKSLRKHYLQEFLYLYHNTFNQVCKVLKTETLPGFTLESFTFRFHRAKLFGLFMTMLILPTMIMDEEENLNAEDQHKDKVHSNVGASDSSVSVEATALLTERLMEVLEELHQEGVI